MEEYKVDNNIIIKNNFNQTISFSEYFYSGIDITPVLTESLEKMKKFISYVLEQLKKSWEKKDEKSSLFLSGKILDFIIDNCAKLGIPFFYMLLKKEEFKNIILNLFYDNILNTKIKQLLGKIIDLFNFDFKNGEIKNYLYIFCDDFINFGVIEKSDLKENEIRESLTEEEELFLNFESTFEHWPDYRDANSEEDAKKFLNYLLKSQESKLTSIISKDILSKASIEFYEENLKTIKNFGNIMNDLKKGQFNINNEDNFKNNNKGEIIKPEDDDDEEDDDEEKSQEEIIEDIKELRKKPLKDRTYFYKDELIKEDEDEYIEYKNYYFPLDEEHKKELERQFCAFLNTNGGRIYIGINDKKMVKGVSIREKIVFYEKKILGLANNFFPKIKPENYFKFYAIPIRDKNNGRIINNLFIFKILIKKGEQTKLYYVFNNILNISIRQAGQCPNLKASEIHEKIIERKNMEFKNNLIKEENLDMDDPAPFINQKIIDNENAKDNWRAQKPLRVKKHKKKSNHKNANNENINIENKIEEEKEFIPKKNKKKKKKNKTKGIFRVEVTNIDKNAAEKELIEFFKGFNCTEIKIFQDQNGNKNGYLMFDNEKDTDNFMDICLGMAVGGQNKNMKLKKIVC